MTNYIHIKIRELDLGVLHWGHFLHTSHVSAHLRTKQNSKLHHYAQKMVADHPLFLHMSPLIVTNYIEIEINELDLRVLH